MLFCFLEYSLLSFWEFSQQRFGKLSERYCTINEHLTWKDHINEIRNKANPANVFLKRNKCINAQYLSNQTLNILTVYYLKTGANKLNYCNNVLPFVTLQAKTSLART